MTAGFILIIVILVLGGVIATVSDRLGTKVGKARLRLFNLRPRNTAVVVTVFTGSVLSALTLAILFAASKPLRTGVFRLDQLQDRLNQARKEVTKVEGEKYRIEAELAQAKEDQGIALARLREINRSLEGAVTQQAQTEAKLKRVQEQLEALEIAKERAESQLAEFAAEKQRIESQLSYTQSQLNLVSQQKEALGSEIATLQKERQKLIEQRAQVQAQIQARDQEIAQQDQIIGEREAAVLAQGRQLQELDQVVERQNQVIAEREELLEALARQQEQLSSQKVALEREVQSLERNVQVLRGGNLAIQRGQVLASGVVRVLEPAAARQVVDQLLQEANRVTLQLTRLGTSPGTNKQIVQITHGEVERLISQIEDGQDYVIRILAEANYVLGETSVKVFATTELNQRIFGAGDVVTSVKVNPLIMGENQIRYQLERLIEAVKFRARSAGMGTGSLQIGDDRIETFIGFLEKLKQYRFPVEIQAVVVEETYTAGRLKINLVALENGQVVFQTGEIGGQGGRGAEEQ